MVKILLIAEEAPLRELFQRDLELEGYQVLAAGSSREGLEMMESASPDLVILDAENRDMDCLDVIGRLLAHCPRIPVVLSTDPSSGRQRSICRVADASIPRSPDTAAMRTQVRKFLAPDAA